MSLDSLKDIPPWEWPGNAREMLMETLRDRRSPASDRIIAADLAGDLVVMNDRMADLLLAVVRNPDEPEEARARAAISLGPALEQSDIEGFDDDDLSEPPISERTFHEIQATLRKTYIDEDVPKEVRRRVLEGSVRAPQDWHRDAVAAAYSSDDEDWKLTAVFCMQYIAGFHNQIVEMLDHANPDIRYEAIRAAGSQELDAAWPHVSEIITSEESDKRLMLAAIEAAGNIRPSEAGPILAELADSEDEEIAEAASEALAMTERDPEEYDEEDEHEDWGKHRPQ